MMRATPILAIPILWGALLLAGCSSPPSTTLTLDVAPPRADAVRAGYAGLPIAIPAVHVPAAIDRVEFVRQVAAGQVEIDDFARWSAPLGTLARDALIRDLTARLPAGSVLPPGATGAAAGTTTLDVTILSYDVVGGEARMQVAFRVVPAGTVRQAILTAPVMDARPVSAANAFTALLGDLADRIADSLPARDAANTELIYRDRTGRGSRAAICRDHGRGNWSPQSSRIATTPSGAQSSALTAMPITRPRKDWVSRA